MNDVRKFARQNWIHRLNKLEFRPFNSVGMNYNRNPWLKINEDMPRIILEVEQNNINLIQDIIKKNSNDNSKHTILLLALLSSYYIKREVEKPNQKKLEFLDDVLNYSKLSEQSKALLKNICHNKFQDI